MNFFMEITPQPVRTKLQELILNNNRCRDTIKRIPSYGSSDSNYRNTRKVGKLQSPS